jgi:hypothetical protein
MLFGISNKNNMFRTNAMFQFKSHSEELAYVTHQINMALAQSSKIECSYVTGTEIKYECSIIITISEASQWFHHLSTK